VQGNGARLSPRQSSEGKGLIGGPYDRLKPVYPPRIFRTGKIGDAGRKTAVRIGYAVQPGTAMTAQVREAASGLGVASHRTRF
jgi:hypothetical protein